MSLRQKVASAVAVSAMAVGSALVAVPPAEAKPLPKCVFVVDNGRTWVEIRNICRYRVDVKAVFSWGKDPRAWIWPNHTKRFSSGIFSHYQRVSFIRYIGW